MSTVRDFLLPYTVLVGLTFLLATGCKDETNHDEQGGTCEAPMLAIYTTPGCGAEVRPSCLGGAGACASSACSCDGRVITTCNGYSKEKYQFVYTQPVDAEACKAQTAQSH